MVFTREDGDFHGRFVSFREGNPQKFFSRLAIGRVRNRGSILRAPPILDTARHLPRPHGPGRESPHRTVEGVIKNLIIIPWVDFFGGIHVVNMPGTQMALVLIGISALFLGGLTFKNRDHLGSRCILHIMNMNNSKKAWLLGWQQLVGS